MSDDREFWMDDQAAWNDDDAAQDDMARDDQSPELPDDDVSDAVNEDEQADDYPLLSADAFDNELEALAAVATVDEVTDDGDDVAVDDDAPYADDVMDAEDALADDESELFDSGMIDESVIDEAAIAAATVDAESAGSTALYDADDDALAVDDETDRLRQPRAGRFRRMVQTQLGMLPLALLALALGGYLLARAQDLAGLPELSDEALAGISVIVIGFAAVFHALLSGRRERGLLFVGLWTLFTAGMVGALVYGLDETPAINEWWPVALWAAGVAFLFTYLIERSHDVRLMLLTVIAIVAGTTAYAVSSERIDQDVLNDVADYWPLLLSVVGVGLLPLVFRRRTE